MEATRIGTKTKIANLVQIGHNGVVGERVIICGGVCIAGSATIENDVTLAGQSGVSGHVTVGAGTIVAAGGGIISDVKAKSVVAGFPQMPMDEWKKTQAALRRLPDLLAEVRELRKRVTELEGK